MECKYALRDEKCNIFAMTHGGVATKYGYQIMICKKHPFREDLGPVVLDAKQSRPVYKMSSMGEEYEKKIQDQSLELFYIAEIEDQIKIKPSLKLFERLKAAGLFSIWEAEAPYSYFEGCKEGYLILFRVYKVDKEIPDILLAKGRKGRNYYYGLSGEVCCEQAVPILNDAAYMNMKKDILQCLNEAKYPYPVEQSVAEGTGGSENPIVHEGEHKYYIRDTGVSAYVKERANGICECCRKPAPFINEEGMPYLEEHHLIPLAQGGSDTVDNVCAVCPNCHRELHYGRNREELMQRIIKNI